MTSILVLSPGSVVRYGKKRYVILDYEGFEYVIAREMTSSEVHRIPIGKARPDMDEETRHLVSPDLIQISEKEWQAALERFELLKPIFDSGKRSSLEDIKAIASKLGKHPATIYRWIDIYRKTQRVSAFLRKGRSDSGITRLPEVVEKIIQQAIQEKYLTVEKPDAASVFDEVRLQCHKAGEQCPHKNTVLARVRDIDGRTKLAKRYSRKIAAEKYEPIRGTFPGASYPLAVVQIDHTPMDVIVVDEIDRLPIGRPFLTIVIDVFSRMILGFAIYLEAPSAFTTGLAIAHAVLPKEDWLREVGVKADWPCWGKMRRIHCDNAKEFRGSVMGRAAVEHNITVEHRPRGQPRYGGHVERGFRTFMKRTHRLKGTTFSNVAEKGPYDSEGRAILTRKELERWFTTYVAKYYPNNFHYGIKTTPWSKYKEGVLGSDTQKGIGLPDRIADPLRFMLDFMPYEERTVQGYGILIDHVYYYDDVLRPWIHAPDVNDPSKKRKFIVRVIPRDMREVYFLDPETNTYIPIPYRDRSHPAVSRWEVLAAEKRLRSQGYANVNEAMLFEAIEEMREIEEGAEKKTKAARRSRERRVSKPPLPTKIHKIPVASAIPPAPILYEDAEGAQEDDDDLVAPFNGIQEPS